MVVVKLITILDELPRGMDMVKRNRKHGYQAFQSYNKENMLFYGSCYDNYCTFVFVKIPVDKDVFHFCSQEIGK